MSDTPPLEAQAFEDLLVSTGGETAFLIELIDTFLADAPALWADLRRSLSAGEAADFRRAAHGLKSNSANFGARTLAALFRELEDMGKAGALAGGEGRLPACEAEYARVVAALREKREQLASAS